LNGKCHYNTRSMYLFSIFRLGSLLLRCVFVGAESLSYYTMPYIYLAAFSFLLSLAFPSEWRIRHCLCFTVPLAVCSLQKPSAPPSPLPSPCRHILSSRLSHPLSLSLVFLILLL
jgi:hypothetical protein